MTEITFSELKEVLRGIDEVTLLELLGLNSYDLVEYLEDYIWQIQDELRGKIENEEEDD